MHSTAETENKMESGLLLNVIIRESATVLKLLSGKDQTLLIRGDSLLVLNLGFNIVDRIRRLHLEGDGLASDCANVSYC